MINAGGTNDARTWLAATDKNGNQPIKENPIPIKYTVQSISQQTVQHIRVPLIILHHIWAREHYY